MSKGVSVVEALQPGEDCLLLPKGPGRRALGRMLRCFSEAPGRCVGGTPRGSLQGCDLFPHSSGVSAAAAAGNQHSVQHRRL